MYIICKIQVCTDLSKHCEFFQYKTALSIFVALLLLLTGGQPHLCIFLWRVLHTSPSHLFYFAQHGTHVQVKFFKKVILFSLFRLPLMVNTIEEYSIHFNQLLMSSIQSEAILKWQWTCLFEGVDAKVQWNRVRAFFTAWWSHWLLWQRLRFQSTMFEIWKYSL